jgi:transcriptional regulator with XRE-family HTH domain
MGRDARRTMLDVEQFPADRYLRAARRYADQSQREMALRAGVSRQFVARAECNPDITRVADLARLLEAAGLHLIVVDDDGREFAPESNEETARTDRGRRRYPAHLDVRSGKQDWWGDGWPVIEGKTPQYTFDRGRSFRDWRREREQLAPDKLRRDELGDLHRVQRGALPEVVVADEQSQPAIALDSGVLPHTTDEARVGTGGLQGSGDVGDGDTGRLPEQIQRARDGQRASELGVDRERVTGEDRNPHAGA